MKKILFFGTFFLIMLVSSFSVPSGTIMNATGSNSSIQLSFEINLTKIQIESTYVAIYNVSYYESLVLKECDLINYSEVNSILDSADFNCNISYSEQEEDPDESSPSSSPISSGGGIFTPKIYLEGNVSYILNKGKNLEIRIENKTNLIRLIEIVGENISIVFNGMNLTLYNGTFQKLDLNEDGFYDLKLKGVVFGESKSQLSFEKIYELIPNEEKEALDERVLFEENSFFEDYWRFFVGGGLLILSFIYLIYFKKILTFFDRKINPSKS